MQEFEPKFVALRVAVALIGLGVHPVSPNALFHRLFESRDAPVRLHRCDADRHDREIPLGPGATDEDRRETAESDQAEAKCTHVAKAPNNPGLLIAISLASSRPA